MHTTNIDALQQLPEGQATSLYYDVDITIYQVTYADCEGTCNVTQVAVVGG
jgi:hypothetical protein